jgi:hypothetical protein
MNNAFSPAWGSGFTITNAITATAAIALPKNGDAIVLTNTSATARVHVDLTQYASEGDALPAGVEPTVTDSLPILPSQQIVVYKGPNLSVIRAIATAADGVLIVTPGSLL